MTYTQRVPVDVATGHQTTQQPHETVWRVATAGFAARCLHVVAAIGAADRIDDTPVPVDAVAADCGVDASALDRVLRLLAAHGIFERQPDGYQHTAASRLLRSEDPTSMRSFAQMMGLPLIWGSLTALETSVRTGRPGLHTLEPAGAWAYLQDHPREAEIFGRAMTAKAAAEITAVLAAYDFTRFATIADIGGGRGHLLRAVLDTAPAATGVLFDLPQVIDTLDVGHPRATATAGDFFTDALPVADAYLLMEVLHDWPDEECTAILRAIHQAAPSGATLLIVESILPDEGGDARAGTLDIVMLAVTGGRERTSDELGALLGRAGFRLEKIIDTASPMRIAAARPI